jgi:hypothetical protein
MASPKKLDPRKLAPFQKSAVVLAGNIPGVPGNAPHAPQVPQAPHAPQVPQVPQVSDATLEIDELINAGLFEALLSSSSGDIIREARAVLSMGKMGTHIDVIQKIFSQDLTPSTLQERRNSLMLWPEAWNAMSVDDFATEILALIESESVTAFNYIRETLKTAIDTTKPACTLGDVLTALSLPADRDSNTYMGIPLTTYIHLRKILVRHTLIYNSSPLQKVVDLFTSLTGDPNMQHNSASKDTLNASIVQYILFGIYYVHDPTHVMKENGIVVGFPSTFTNLWRSEQQVKAQVFLSGKTVKESLSTIEGYEEAKREGRAPGSEHDSDTIDLYGNYRTLDPTTRTPWNNPEAKFVSWIRDRLQKIHVVEGSKDLPRVLSLVNTVLACPGPETPTYVHMFIDNKGPSVHAEGGSQSYFSFIQLLFPLYDTNKTTMPEFAEGNFNPILRAYLEGMKGKFRNNAARLNKGAVTAYGPNINSNAGRNEPVGFSRLGPVQGARGSVTNANLGPSTLERRVYPGGLAAGIANWKGGKRKTRSTKRKMRKTRKASRPSE